MGTGVRGRSRPGPRTPEAPSNWVQCRGIDHGPQSKAPMTQAALWPAAEESAALLIQTRGLIGKAIADLTDVGMLFVRCADGISHHPAEAMRADDAEIATRVLLDFLRTPRFSPFDLTTRNRSVLGFNLSYLFDRADMLQRGMSEILDWVATGRLRLAKVTPYPLEAVAEAHRALESGQTTGKLVLVMEEAIAT